MPSTYFHSRKVKKYFHKIFHSCVMSSISTNITNKFCAQSHVPFVFRAVWYGTQSDIRVLMGQICRSSITSPFCFLSVTSNQPVKIRVLLMPENPSRFPIRCSDSLKFIRSPALYPSWETCLSFRLSVSIPKKSLITVWRG